MRRTRLTSALLALLMILSLLTTLALAAVPAEDQVYSAMIALKSDYPEGMHWTNDNRYEWRGSYVTGFGCAAFAFILSDAAFGDLPARTVRDFSYEDIRVGDILRINNNTHSVIVLEKHPDHVIIAEGNYNSSIHWGRKLDRSVVESADYILTRYPSESAPDQPKPVESVDPFTDVPVTAYYADAVRWAVAENVTNGTSGTTFSPADGCTRAQVVTFLWRALDCPEPASSATPFRDIKKGAFYEKAVAWAVENNITNGTDETHFSPDAVCTRAQIVTLIWRAARCPEPESMTTPFTDVKAGSYYEKAVASVTEYGITNGVAPDRFGPDTICTRGQIVTFLYRAGK